MRRVILLLSMLFFLNINNTRAQIPVELMAGDKKASIDLMFFTFFRNANNENSKWLFFNRSRSTVDYKMTAGNNLPSFGLTEAISYNHPALMGFAPVAVIQLFNRGVFPKAGIQYVHMQNGFTIFSWLVCEVLNKPNFDYFLLMRYTPKLNSKWHIYTQFETVNTFPTRPAANFSFTQRLRVGLMRKDLQFGVAGDLSQNGNGTFLSSTNTGAFIRYAFR